MKAPTIPPVYLLAGGAVIAALAYIKFKGAAGIGASIGAGAVELVDSVVSETVIAGGEVVGIPRTDLTECEKAKAEGRTWDASFACPAGDFLKYLF
jgi:hypothetical protein